ncbi:GNAT family N-acetyltransferase [Halorussus salilacus]|uniref:GNAT family N-acetyltransferase n=1 Tax=Halorussus salilacus TaxID=2953750 RepID=UPI00209F8855|nr:GNAT family N-acetyltransferase [Halorussus salilacus]USZ68590.1 GNAT family N-acetyltransferase [Halorussus salilacus]
MEYALVGWPDEGPQLRLDHREFSYAGKFVMSNTGKAVARNDAGPGRDGGDDLVAAVAFNEDRTDPGTAWLRYVTVRDDRRGEGVGARLAAFASDRLEARGYDRVQIAVNNPFAYHALHKAGFGYTGERTGLAELVLARPGDRARESYQAGLDAYRERDDLAPEEREFLEAKAGEGPPDVISVPE